VKVIASGRQTGRTTQLIQQAADEFLYVVCPTLDRANYVARKARELGLDIPNPMTWREFTEQRFYGKGINGFVIDDLDHCLQSMTPVQIMAVSLEA
jgi:hypothetical protein